MPTAERPPRFTVTMAALGWAGLLLGLPLLLQVTRQGLEAAGGAEVPLGVLIAVQLVQLGLLVLLAAWVGARFAPLLGLDAPVVRAALLGQRWWPVLRARLAVPAFAGTAGALAVLALVHLYFLPRLPAQLQGGAGGGSLVAAASSLFYGGLTEEVLVRWGVMTLLAVGLHRLRVPLVPALWTANAGAALLFALGHLPAASSVLGGALPPLVVLYLLVGNGALGILFGWLYIRRGVEAAMVAHLVADFWLHLLPAIVARFW